MPLILMGKDYDFWNQQSLFYICPQSYRTQYAWKTWPRPFRPQRVPFFKLTVLLGHTFSTAVPSRPLSWKMQINFFWFRMFTVDIDETYFQQKGATSCAAHETMFCWLLVHLTYKKNTQIGSHMITMDDGIVVFSIHINKDRSRSSIRYKRHWDRNND